MFCFKCGFKLPANAKFCPNCGIEQSNQISTPVDEAFTVQDSNRRKWSSSGTISKVSTVRGQAVDEGKPSLRETARKEKEAMYFGLIALAVWGILLILVDLEIINNESSRANLSVVALITRLIAVIWIIGIAGRLERSKTAWAIFAALAPAIALIIIGNLTTPRSVHRQK